MTDNFPKDEQKSMIPEDSFAIEEENLGETWNEPPSSEDGFSDSEIMHEDYQEPEEMHEEYQDSNEVHGDEIQESSSENNSEEVVVDKRRGKVVLLGLVGAGILFIGGIAYLQLNQQDGASSLVSLMQTADVGNVVPQAQPQKLDSDVTPTTEETDLALLYQAAKQQAAPSNVIGLAGDTDKVEGSSNKEGAPRSTNIILHDNSADIIPPSPMPQEEVKAPAVKPEPEVAKIETIQVKPVVSELSQDEFNSLAKKTEPEIAKIETIQVKPAVPELSEKSSVPVETIVQLKEMEEKISKLEKELVTANKAKEEVAAKLEEVEKRPAPVAVPSPVIGKDQSEIIEKIEAKLALRDNELEAARQRMSEVMSENDVLSQQVESMKKKLSSASQTEKQLKKKLIKKAEVKTKIEVEKKEDLLQTLNDRPLKDEPIRGASLKIESSPPASSVKEEVAAAVKQEEHVLTLPVGNTGLLVLRAATPKAAWVAQSKTSLDLKKIQIGDVLPQIGKIISIRQKGNIWEVVGTAGVLR